MDVDILIVGGGAAGLTASNLLQRLGLRSLLVERHAGTSHLPKAHYQNQRAMEVFRQIGIDGPIYAAGPQPEQMGKIIWHTSFGGDGPLDRKVIHAADALGGGRFAAEHATKSAARATNVPQIRLEPILRRLAATANAGMVRFGHEFVSFRDTSDGVEASIRDLSTGEIYAVHARYLIAADGGKTVGPALGVKMLGPTNLADYVSVYFEADLSKYIPDDTAVMRCVMHTDQQPDRPPVGGLLALGPKHWNRHSEEWAVTWGFAPDDPMRADDDDMAARIQAFLKVDAPIHVKLISHWRLEAVVAERFRVGRAFLVGDAAHRHTPGGGLGLNSGVQDVHNLCWKLALVCRGLAAECLLDTYEPERKPVVSQNAQSSLLVFSNHNVLVSAMGLMPGASAEHNHAAFAQLFADDVDGKARRARLAATFDAIIGVEYGPHDLEMGYRYESSAVVPDGAAAPERDPLGVHYTPSSSPGCRLPHAWLSERGSLKSTHDFIPPDGFLLLTGSEGGEWVAAAQKIAAQRALVVHPIRIAQGADVTDPSGTWARVCDISPSGAILVRPDGHVAFRSRDRAPNAQATLEQVISQILGDGVAPREQRRHIGQRWSGAGR